MREFFFNFPSFSEGLSLRGVEYRDEAGPDGAGFPFLFGGAFIEGPSPPASPSTYHTISLPFRRGFH